MITPVNNHLLIEPLKHEDFILSDRGIYEEIGTVVDTNGSVPDFKVSQGDRVYFDSWLCVKYPKDDKSFYWLVRAEDIRAVEYANEVPK